MPGSSSILLDTNAFIAAGSQDYLFAQQVGQYEDLLVALNTVAELFFGVLKSQRVLENRTRLQARLTHHQILLPDQMTAEIYAEVCMTLRRKGRPIPDNDIWIAAIAIQHGLPVMTNDQHFQNIDRLEVVTW